MVINLYRIQHPHTNDTSSVVEPKIHLSHLASVIELIGHARLGFFQHRPTGIIFRSLNFWRKFSYFSPFKQCTMDRRCLHRSTLVSFLPIDGLVSPLGKLRSGLPCSR
jgi:hypothetical protein